MAALRRYRASDGARSIAAGTYSVGFLPLNGPRHVRTLTPCLQAVHEEIFGENLTGLVGHRLLHLVSVSVVSLPRLLLRGPYCCAQFAVSRETIQQRSLETCMQQFGFLFGW